MLRKFRAARHTFTLGRRDGGLEVSSPVSSRRAPSGEVFWRCASRRRAPSRT